MSRGHDDLDEQWREAMERDSEILTPREVAAWLSISEEHVMRLARRGELPSFRLGRWIRFRRATVEAYMEAIERVGEEAQG